MLYDLVPSQPHFPQICSLLHINKYVSYLVYPYLKYSDVSVSSLSAGPYLNAAFPLVQSAGCPYTPISTVTMPNILVTYLLVVPSSTRLQSFLKSKIVKGRVFMYQ